MTHTLTSVDSTFIEQGTASAKHTVSTNYLLMLTTGLMRHGFTEAQVLEALSLDTMPERHNTQRIPLAELIEFWQTSQHLLADPLLAIDIGSHIHPNDYNLIGALVLNCSTVEDAIKTGFQFEELMSGCLPTLRFKEKDRMIMRVNSHDYDIEYIRPFIEHDFAAQIELGHLMTARMLPTDAIEVHFRHTPKASIAEYEKRLGAKVSFNMQHNQILLPASTLAFPVHAPNAELKDLLQTHIEDIHHKVRSNSLFKIRIENHILHSIGSGLPTLEDSAIHFNMSSATLKRKLAQENSSYREICYRIRLTIAKQLLADPQAKVTDIALQLDYSSPTAFISAFKRWTQLTPLQFRQSSKR